MVADIVLLLLMLLLLLIPLLPPLTTAATAAAGMGGTAAILTSVTLTCYARSIPIDREFLETHKRPPFSVSTYYKSPGTTI